MAVQGILKDILNTVLSRTFKTFNFAQKHERLPKSLHPKITLPKAHQKRFSFFQPGNPLSSGCAARRAGEPPREGDLAGNCPCGGSGETP